MFTLAEGTISWRSGKQGVMDASTMQAEFVACYDAIGQKVWLKNFIPALRVVDSISRPITMHCDNLQYSFGQTISCLVLLSTLTSNIVS